MLLHHLKCMRIKKIFWIQNLPKSQNFLNWKIIEANVCLGGEKGGISTDKGVPKLPSRWQKKTNKQRKQKPAFPVNSEL